MSLNYEQLRTVFLQLKKRTRLFDYREDILQEMLKMIQRKEDSA